MDRVASYTLVVLETLSALRDEHGQVYTWTPCMELPLAWDESQPLNVRRRAAEICHSHCPAIFACEQAMKRLEAEGGTPTGVWAGQVLNPRAAVERSTTRLPALPPDPSRLVGLSVTVRHVMPERNVCKYCGARMLWALTPDNRAMPLDPTPSPTGNVAVIRDDRGRVRARTLARGDELSPGERRHVAHFATCPNRPRKPASTTQRHAGPRRGGASRDQLAFEVG